MAEGYVDFLASFDRGVVVLDDEGGFTLEDLFGLDPLLRGRIEERGECWVWTGSQVRSGYRAEARYGKVRRGQRSWLIHRWVYSLAIGPIPAEHDIHHDEDMGCEYTRCVRPLHLEPIERVEHTHHHNARDRAAAEEAA